MTSEAMKRESSPLPEGKWMAYRQEGNGFQILREETICAMTVMELVNGPYAIRFDLPSGRVYFIGLNDDLYRTLISQGKRVLWILDLLDSIWSKLIGKGLPRDTVFLGWRVRDFWKFLNGIEGDALEIFNPTQVGVMQ